MIMMKQTQLKKASEKDVHTLWKLQRDIFRLNVEKYGFELDPGNESIEEVRRLISEGRQEAFIIMEEGTEKGIVWTSSAHEDGTDESRWLFKMGVLDEFQGEGIAKRAILELEKLYPDTFIWYLNVISEEKGARTLYEKMGYEEMDYETPFVPGAKLVYYQKIKA